MRIIYYEPEHLAACAHLLIEVYNTTTWDCRWSTEKAKTYIEELTQMPRFVGFLLEDDGEIVGVSLCHERTWWRHDELNINGLYLTDLNIVIWNTLDSIYGEVCERKKSSWYYLDD
ncbi:MAG: hypothetical protein ACLRQX_09345 [Turicibacter sanguinis]